MERDPALPQQSAWLVRWFSRYACRYAGKHFHAVRLSKQSAEIPAEGAPLLFALNHPSWWDVITAIVLTQRWPAYKHFAPIEATMLAKYRFFAKLGMFGIEPTSRGAAVFLRTCRAIFADSHRALWVTVQGRFSDPRERPLDLRPGVGGVASRLTSGYIIPVAVEYPFWNESKPELLIRFGQALSVAENPGLVAQQWTEKLTFALTHTMDELAREALSRDPALFTTLINGTVGVGGIYDWWRRFKGYLRGRKTYLGHGAPEKPEVPQP